MWFIQGKKMTINNFVKYVRNKIRISKTFWMFRHLIHNDIWHSYYESYSTDRRFFYSDLVRKNNYQTVFEFGSASGPNLKNIELYSSHQTFLFGFDISRGGSWICKKKFNPRSTFFTTVISENIFKSKLHDWGCSNFDLAIYDRVLYLLDEREVKEHFFKFQKYFSVVVIDDFHNSQFIDKNDSYLSKNYENIMSVFGFKLMVDEKSKHLVSDVFFW